MYTNTGRDAFHRVPFFNKSVLGTRWNASLPGMAATALLLVAVLPALADSTNSAPEIRTPKPPHTPRINGPAVFGVRPGPPFLYRLSATGARPIKVAPEGVAPGLKGEFQT